MPTREILISARVQGAVGADIALEPRPPISLKGKAEPLPVFAVSGASRRRAIRLEEPSYTLPMVGRAAIGGAPLGRRRCSRTSDAKTNVGNVPMIAASDSSEPRQVAGGGPATYKK